MEKRDEQDSTDFMKCVELVRERDPIHATLAQQEGNHDATTSNISHEQLLSQNLEVVALGGLGGRFDQSMSSIHHLYILSRERHARLVSDESIVVVLGAVRQHSLFFSNCGFVEFVFRIDKQLFNRTIFFVLCSLGHI